MQFGGSGYFGRILFSSYLKYSESDPLRLYEGRIGVGSLQPECSQSNRQFRLLIIWYLYWLVAYVDTAIGLNQCLTQIKFQIHVYTSYT